MTYWKCTVETRHCGTEETHYFKGDEYNDPFLREEVGAELAQNNAESYEYLAFGWNNTAVEDGEMTEEEYQAEIESYYEDISFYWKQITEEEYREEMGD